MNKISICLITYNHASYITQAIESVLAQRGPGLELELVIGEDESTDDTRQIVIDYARRYPDIIKPLLHTPNIGGEANVRACMAACTGEFIAVLEGDDYWTDPDKLRRQVAALRNNPDCTLCAHDAETFYDGESTTAWTFAEKFAHILPAPGEMPREYTQSDLARFGWFLPTASLLFRASSLPRPIPEWFEKVFSGDFTLQLLVTQHGSALYLPRVMSAYRLHAGGLMNTSHNTLFQNKRRIFENELYKQLLPAKLHCCIDESLEHLYFERSEKLGAEGAVGWQLYYYGKAITVSRQRFLFHLSRLARRALAATGRAEKGAHYR